MNVITVKQKGDFKFLENFLQKMRDKKLNAVLNKYGQMGVEALSAATPKKTGTTAASWTYEIREEGGNLVLGWSNGNVSKGWFNVALMLQLGHGTRNGGYVTGIDYINPALKPIFDGYAEEMWREVTSN